MFTGIVAGTGRVLSIENRGQEARIGIAPSFPLANLVDGESIAINGVCLSVEKRQGSNFSAYASAETLSRSNLGQLHSGSEVNLERALALGERLGGHIVTGHIDCVATLAGKFSLGESLRLRLNFPREFSPYVIAKGSVALNGISLTVNACGADFLEVNIIPDSQRRTNLPQWRSGDKINMETDILGKYVERLLRPWEQDSPGMSKEFLAMQGFI